MHIDRAIDYITQFQRAYQDNGSLEDTLTYDLAWSEREGVFRRLTGFSYCVNAIFVLLGLRHQNNGSILQHSFKVLKAGIDLPEYADKINKFVQEFESDFSLAKDKQSLEEYCDEMDAELLCKKKEPEPLLTAEQKELAAKAISTFYDRLGSENKLYTIISRNTYTILSVNGIEGAVFKVIYNGNNRNKSVERRFENGEWARKYIAKNKLHKLVVPESELLYVEGQGEKIPVIVEKKYDLGSYSQQKDLWTTRKNQLHQTVKQITQFCLKSDFSDVKWDNIPLERKLFKSKIILVDLEHFQSLSSNIFCLISCVHPDHFPSLEKKIAFSPFWWAVRCFDSQNYAKSKQERVKSLAQDSSIQEYHKSKGIASGHLLPVLPDLTYPEIQIIEALNQNLTQLTTKTGLRFIDQRCAFLKMSEDKTIRTLLDRYQKEGHIHHYDFDTNYNYFSVQC